MSFKPVGSPVFETNGNGSFFQGKAYKIMVKNGQEISFRFVQVKDGYLYGDKSKVRGRTAEGKMGTWVKYAHPIPIAEITEVEQLKFNPGRSLVTSFLVIGMIGAIFIPGYGFAD